MKFRIMINMLPHIAKTTNEMECVKIHYPIFQASTVSL